MKTPEVTEAMIEAGIAAENECERDNLETVRRAIWNLVPGHKEATVDAIARAALFSLTKRVNQ